MTNLLVAALSFAVSQILLSQALLLRDVRRWHHQQTILMLFLFAVLAYLLHPVFTEHWFQAWLIPIETAVPGLFWLLCCSLFDDRFSVRFWNLGLVAVTVFLPLLGSWMLTLALPAPAFIVDTLPQALEFVLLGWALYVVLRLWRDDLVEARRDLRLIFSAIAGAYILTLIVLRELVITDAEWLAQSQYLPVGLVCLVMNLLFLQYRPVIFHRRDVIRAALKSDLPPEHRESIEVPLELIKQLEVLMTEDRVYREMGLTIGGLAKRLNLPEYRLRRIINTGLGFRNFNDYLNGFRINEAGERLANQAMQEDAVLTIALEVGFRSLSSFNKAFLRAYGVTPTAYRQQHLDGAKNR